MEENRIIKGNQHCLVSGLLIRDDQNDVQGEEKQKKHFYRRLWMAQGSGTKLVKARSEEQVGTWFDGPSMLDGSELTR